MGMGGHIKIVFHSNSPWLGDRDGDSDHKYLTFIFNCERAVQQGLIEFIPVSRCVVSLSRCPGVSSSIVSVCLEHCVASSLCLVSFFLSVTKKPS